MLPFVFHAQNIKGFIYDSEATVKGAKLLNTTQKTLSYSNDKGAFQIRANVNDTIIITSYFHKKKAHIVSKKDLQGEIVIELQKVTTQLDEVEITKIIEKSFDSITINTETKSQIANDIKKRPYLYGTQPNSNIDFVAIGKLIGKLFKKKKRTEIKTISLEDLLRTFEESTLFNMNFLHKELNIPKDYGFLFLEYLSAQKLDASLLSSDNEIMLLDELIKHGKVFNALLEEQKKD